MDVQLWSEKYKPLNVDDVIGQSVAVKALNDAFQRFVQGGLSKPIVVFGPTGCGKTTLVKTVANKWDFEVITFGSISEVGDLKRILNSSGSYTLDHRRRVILFDGIEGFSRELLGTIRKNLDMLLRDMVIFIATDFYNRRIRWLRESCIKIELRRLSWKSIYKVLKRVASLEECSNLTDDILITLSKSVRGDLRAAINDLQALCSIPSGVSKNESVVGNRFGEKSIFSVLDSIFFGSFEDSRKSVDEASVEPRELTFWVYENIFNIERHRLPYDLNRISKIDLLLNRAERGRFWHLISYVIDLLLLSFKREKTWRSRYSYPVLLRYRRTVVEPLSFRYLMHASASDTLRALKMIYRNIKDKGTFLNWLTVKTGIERDKLIDALSDADTSY